jgi:hypothetical protein
LAGIFFASFLLRKSGSSPCILFFDNFGGLSFTTNGHLVGFGGNEVGRSLPWISLEVYEIPVLLGRIYSPGGGLHLGRAKNLDDRRILEKLCVDPKFKGLSSN